ncbi:MAG: NGG1p interacting factor NIF3 [Candidatus Omnitrophica bacterium]|nr:NGG1p interacting factor NIF3 [Candidatus Omnitrophota bacterium]
MKLSQFYDHVVKLGSDRDPRHEKSKITSYGDTAILHGNPDIQVRKIMLGIDIEVGELLLADRIRQRQGLDLVVSHHPEGKAYARLHEVMQIQVDVLQKIGLDRIIAQKMLDERKAEVARRILPQNHTRPVDAARILDLPFMCMHTPADNHAFSFINSLMEKKLPKTVQDIIEILKGVPEYKEAAKHNAGPRIIVGNPKRCVGKILVEMTGGTEGPKDIFDKLYKAGVRTLISMHLSEEHFKRVLDANLSVVIAGHISSDNLGINLLLDRIEKEAKQKLQIISCSGFNRITRN